MQPTYLAGTNLSAAALDGDTLYITFHSGQSYRYDNVPYSAFDALCKAESPGQFFHRFIRSKYTFKKLDCDPFAHQVVVRGSDRRTGEVRATF